MRWLEVFPKNVNDDVSFVISHKYVSCSSCNSIRSETAIILSLILRLRKALLLNFRNSEEASSLF